MTILRTSGVAALAIAMSYALIAPLSADEGEPLTYPLVVTTPTELEALGLSLVRPDDTSSPWRSKACESHTTPPPPLLIAVSDDLAADYIGRGFTRETLCLALYSAALYDPYSGERLPTVVLRDDAGIERVLAGRDPDLVDDTELIDAGVLTDELPLAVPDCFKNGTPHRDCDWRFSERKGRQRTEGAIARFKAAGAALDEAMQAAIAAATANSTPPTGIARRDAFQGEPQTFRLPDAILRTVVNGSPLAYQWFELGAHLPGGYAYAIPPYDNERRPTLSVAATKEKLSGKKPMAQVDAAKVKDAMKRRRG